MAYRHTETVTHTTQQKHRYFRLPKICNTHLTPSHLTMKLSNVLVAAASLLAAPTLAGNLKPDYVMEEACTSGREDTRSCCMSIFKQIHHTRQEYHRAKTDYRIDSRTANGQTLTLVVECKHKEWTVVDDCFFKSCRLLISRR